ncbi:hypothetical protein HYPSUDRAFT_200666 [Hypholoma sublateritium FD-334 SS-4]|uniref:Uncharacterized protein n=1 Tax=Hypholoma sublateritium (strain FD-334 SS-4) TaxID=945553 RepID=A0A0D2PYK2_HYPSF|nr:hypothetical protein HYPSUDRAFT_200666 [Hypholoma sublateritium FD-334 SS-4]
MPIKLVFYLPSLSAEDRATLFGSLVAVTAYPRGNPIREGVISGVFSYDAHHILTIAATVFAVVPFALAFWMPKW